MLGVLWAGGPWVTVHGGEGQRVSEMTGAIGLSTYYDQRRVDVERLLDCDGVNGHMIVNASPDRDQCPCQLPTPPTLHTLDTLHPRLGRISRVST